MGRAGLILADLLTLARLLVELRAAVRSDPGHPPRAAAGPDPQQVGSTGPDAGAPEESGGG